MFKIRFILTALLIMFAANLGANAATIGYADFSKVLTEYKYARNAYKDIDNKLMELQQYVMDKEKQFKTIESPIQRKTFEDQIQKEKEIKNNILAASKAVATAKKLDVVLDYGVVYAGGVDVTNDIIQHLNAPKK